MVSTNLTYHKEPLIRSWFDVPIKSIWNLKLYNSQSAYGKYFTHLVKKHLNKHIIYYNFSFLIEKSFWNLSSSLHNLASLILLNSFSLLLLSTFPLFLKSLDNYFFRWLANKSLLSRFSVLMNYIKCACNLFLDPVVSHVFKVWVFFRVQLF